jgi:hypothetical protein
MVRETEIVREMKGDRDIRRKTHIEIKCKVE